MEPVCVMFFKSVVFKDSLCFQAIQSLSKLSHSKPGLDKLFQSDLLTVMKDVMATSDIVRYRIYEVCYFKCLHCNVC